MTDEELIAKLQNMRHQAGDGRLYSAMLLFALLHADELRQRTTQALDAIAATGAGRHSYGSEFRKMIALAPYVEVRPDYEQNLYGGD